MSNVIYLHRDLKDEQEKNQRNASRISYLTEKGWIVFNDYVMDKMNNIYSVDQAIIIQKDRDDLSARYIRLPFYKKLLHVFCDQLR